MRLLYDAETDSLYIEFSARPGSDVREVVDGVVVDLDEDGNVVGIDIDHASKKLDLTTLEPGVLPLPAA